MLLIKLTDVFTINMDKLEQEKLAKQISMLCEMQFRKGFQQGFYASENKRLTSKQVDKFRTDGAMEKYSKVKDPYSGVKENSKDRLLAEIGMSDMMELEIILETLR